MKPVRILLHFSVPRPLVTYTASGPEARAGAGRSSLLLDIYAARKSSKMYESSSEVEIIPSGGGWQEATKTTQ